MESDLPRIATDSRPLGWMADHCPNLAASTANVAVGCALTFSLGFASIWYAGNSEPRHGVAPLTADDIAIPHQIPYPRIYVAAAYQVAPPAVLLPVERVHVVDVIVPTVKKKKRRVCNSRGQCWRE